MTPSSSSSVACLHRKMWSEFNFILSLGEGKMEDLPDSALTVGCTHTCFLPVNMETSNVWRHSRDRNQNN